jgi:type II secretory pathway pseudopilin PulG
MGPGRPGLLVKHLARRRTMKSMKHTRQLAAFTLVELLVVIGIIAIMLSILLPTLAGARQRAQSVACLSNLRQIGQSAIIYATENKGYFWQSCPVNPLPIPGSNPIKNVYDDSFYRFSKDEAAAISRTMRGATKVWYCPANQFNPPAGQREITENDFYPDDHPPLSWDGTINMGRTRYWWLGNPNPPDYNGPLVDTTGQGDFFATNTPGSIGPPNMKAPAYRDANRNGTIRDEYLRKLNDKKPAEIVICTDQSGQLSAAGWFFIHGKLSVLPANSPQAERKKYVRSWKNNLYGDGHAESKRPDEVEWRWNANATGAYCW